MTRPATRAFPGKPDQVACARAFVRSALGNCPALDDIVMLASELCANAVRHTASADGGSFEVTVRLLRESARIEVRDDGGSATIPQAGDPGEASEYGRGLRIVAALADDWGYQDDEHGRTVFFELTWVTPRARPAPPARPELPAPRRETAPPVTAGAAAS
jgi:anti-sigma regulatory factor (Ser/Thr protein kinase)